MSFARTPSQQESIEDLRQRVNELSAIISGLIAYIASVSNASNVDAEKLVSLASSVTQKSTFDLSGRKIDVAKEAQRAALRILDLAQANKAG
jgi:hypothetical protein